MAPHGQTHSLLTRGGGRRLEEQAALVRGELGYAGGKPGEGDAALDRYRRVVGRRSVGRGERAQASTPPDAADVKAPGYPATPPREVLFGGKPIGMPKGADDHVMEEVVNVTALDS